MNFKRAAGALLGAVSSLAVAGSDTLMAEGEAVYDRLCMACHQTGVAGAPVRGDDEAWALRLEQGLETLVQHAIDGIGAMPPRGGNPNLSDADIRAATLYLLDPISDETWPLDALEDGNAADASPLQEGADDEGTDEKSVDEPAQSSIGPSLDGEALYSRARCATCHATGIAGSPTLGDSRAWSSRLEKGREALYQSVIAGKGVMPPRGASTASDEELKAMVDFMVEQSQ